MDIGNSTNQEPMGMSGCLNLYDVELDEWVDESQQMLVLEVNARIKKQKIGIRAYQAHSVCLYIVM